MAPTEQGQAQTDAQSCKGRYALGARLGGGLSRLRTLVALGDEVRLTRILYS